MSCAAKIEALNKALRQYRDMFKAGSATFPKTTNERETPVRLFRKDLGLT